MSRTLGRVQRGGSPFAGGGGHTLGHTFCVSTPHPAYGFLAYGFLDGLRQRQGSLKVPLIFSRKRQGMRIPHQLINGYCIPDRSPLGLHPSGHPAKHKDSLKFSACFLWSLRDWLNGEMIARHLHFSLCLSSVSPAGRAGELRSNS